MSHSGMFTFDELLDMDADKIMDMRPRRQLGLRTMIANFIIEQRQRGVSSEDIRKALVEGLFMDGDK